MSAKILVVDDEHDMLEMLSYNLKEEGYEVLTADNGLEALNKARRFLPDLIVLDLMLDGIDGYSICEILRCQPSTANMPVIIVTALSGQIARLNGLAAGADDYLTKPFSPRELLIRVENLLRLYEKRRESAAAGAESSS